MTEEEFQLVVEGFLVRYDLTPTTFGLWAMGDSRFVFDLRRGRSCSLATVGKVRRFMDEYNSKQEAKRARNLRGQPEKRGVVVPDAKLAGSEG